MDLVLMYDKVKFQLWAMMFMKVWIEMRMESRVSFRMVKPAAPRLICKLVAFYNARWIWY